MTKKNLKRHTRMYHSGSEEAWMIIWKERNLMEHQNPNPAMTPKTAGRTFIWCKHCFSEGKKQEECRMMKKNLKRHSASKKHANEAFFTSWPGRSGRKPKNIGNSSNRVLRVPFPASISASGVKNESFYSTSSSVIKPESGGAPMAKEIVFEPRIVSSASQFESSTVSVKVEPK